jgi:hypothetical protein
MAWSRQEKSKSHGRKEKKDNIKNTDEDIHSLGLIHFHCGLRECNQETCMMEARCWNSTAGLELRTPAHPSNPTTTLDQSASTFYLSVILAKQLYSPMESCFNVWVSYQPPPMAFQPYFVCSTFASTFSSITAGGSAEEESNNHTCPQSCLENRCWSVYPVIGRSRKSQHRMFSRLLLSEFRMRSTNGEWEKKVRSRCWELLLSEQ